MGLELIKIKRTIKTLETDRLILREWTMDDVEDLYEYGKDERVGPYAGWRAHNSIEDSKYQIRHFLSDRDCENRAIVFKENNKVIGNISLNKNPQRRWSWGKDERNLGYVLNPEYWGRGIMPEAARAVLDYSFYELELNAVWCGHYDFNKKSKRVIEKLQFEPVYRKREVLFHMHDRIAYAYYYKIEREDYLKREP